MKKIKSKEFKPLSYTSVEQALQLINDTHWEFVDIKFMLVEDKVILIYYEKEDSMEPDKPIVAPIVDKTTPPIQDVRKYESLGVEQRVSTEEPKAQSKMMEIISEYKWMIVIAAAIIFVIYMVTKG